ncbi:J domain-containing protein [Favolaschia claudopus]|uniref:J domain-containing protein n=1 Tax=Favolaschia claudopus TaxID=2862362 RepID=A0AAW0DYE2_9AGAR
MHRRALFSTACRRATHYDTLGIRREASAAQIKTAFIAMSKSHHPDVPHHKEKPEYHEISEAYNVLRDPVTRRAYDNTLPDPQASPASTLQSRHMADTAARLRRAHARSSRPTQPGASSSTTSRKNHRSTTPPFPRRPSSQDHPLPGAQERHHLHPGQRYKPPDPVAQAAAWAAQQEMLREQKTRSQKLMAGTMFTFGALFMLGWFLS